MPLKTLFKIGFVALFAIAVDLAEAAEKIKSSRPEWPGCKWKSYVDKNLGVALRYQDCKASNAHYVLSTKGNIIEQHRPSDDRTYDGPTVLELYQKKPDEGAVQAIKKRFVDPLTKEERANCVVTADKSPRAPTAARRFRITAAKSYEDKVVKQFQKENPEGGVPYDYLCGKHGHWAEGDGYFEFHPAESKTKYAWIEVGQDEPLFDEQSIVFTDGPGSEVVNWDKPSKEALVERALSDQVTDPKAIIVWAKQYQVDLTEAEVQKIKADLGKK